MCTTQYKTFSESSVRRIVLLSLTTLLADTLEARLNILFILAGLLACFVRFSNYFIYHIDLIRLDLTESVPS